MHWKCVMVIQVAALHFGAVLHHEHSSCRFSSRQGDSFLANFPSCQVNYTALVSADLECLRGFSADVSGLSPAAAACVLKEDKYGAHNYHPLPVVLSKVRPPMIMDCV